MASRNDGHRFAPIASRMRCYACGMPLSTYNVVEHPFTCEDWSNEILNGPTGKVPSGDPQRRSVELWTNTYTKLRDGTWGVRSTNPRMVKGRKTTVTVKKKNGDTAAHDVECFHHGNDSNGDHYALCKIVDVDS